MEGMLSPADVAVLSGNRGGNNGANNGFGDMGAWWVIIFLIFAFGGWGGRGFGGNGSNGGSGSTGGGVMDAYVLSSDFGALQRQISDGFRGVDNAVAQVNNGLCNGFYENARLTDGVNQNIASSTAALQSTLCQGFYGVNTGMLTNGYETRNAISNLSSQLAECCCTTQRSIDNVMFNNAQNTCAITNAINTSTRDMIENCNANYRALHDEIIANRIEDKNAQIAAQQNEINKLQLAASQAAQNQYLISELSPKCPVPAYLTCNPNQSYSLNQLYGLNGGCCGNY